MNQIEDPVTSEQILESLLRERVGLDILARRHFKEPALLRDLADWSAREQSAGVVGALRLLIEQRTDMQLALAQTDATALLLEIARGNPDASDLARKACNDLLRAPRHSRVPARQRAARVSAKPDPEEVANARQVVRTFLAEFGKAPAPHEAPEQSEAAPPNGAMRMGESG